MYPTLLSIPWPLAAGAEDSRLTLSSYSVCLTLAVVLGWWLTVRQARRAALDERAVAEATVVALFGGVFAARAGYLWAIAERASSLRDVLALYRGGLLGYGAICGGLVCAGWWLRRGRVRLVAWLDLAAPGFAVGAVFVRAGCYLEGCDYGAPLSDESWLKAVGFAAHPTQLYEMLGATLLAALATLTLRSQRFNGQVGLTVLFGYSLLRAVVEPWRADLPRGSFGPELKEPVVAGLSLIVLGAAFAYGPALSLKRGPARSLLCSLMPVAGVLVLVVGRSGPSEIVRLSVSQWSALGLALLVGWSWQTLRARALDEK